MDEMNHNQMPSQQPQGGSGLSVASMVLGIISLVLFCIAWICFPCGIVSIILGGVSISGKKPGKGMAVAGLVCSIVAIALYIIFTIIGLSMLDELGIAY